MAAIPTADDTVDARTSHALATILKSHHMLPQFMPHPDYLSALTCLLPGEFPTRKFFVLYGLGGMGETQIALRFAKLHQEAFTLIFLIDASSKHAVLASFEEIHHRLFQEEDAPQNAYELITEVTQRLDDDGNWLLVFDNITKRSPDEEDWFAASYIPQSNHGSIIFTIRVAPLPAPGRTSKARGMDQEEAMKLVNTILNSNLSFRKEPEMGSSRSIEQLPPTILQSIQSIGILNIQLETFLDLYYSSSHRLMTEFSLNIHELALPPLAKQQDDLERWSIARDKLKIEASRRSSDHDEYSAYRLLQLLLYFDPSDLNYDIFRFGAIGNNLPAWFRNTVSAESQFKRVVNILIKIGLVTATINESYSMPRRVHDCLSNESRVEEDRDLLRIAVSAISFSIPLMKTFDWYTEQQRLVMHALHILPWINGVRLEDFLVRYDLMSQEQLQVASELLGEPVRCLQLMKFDYTLIGIIQLLKSCRSYAKAFELTENAEKNITRISDSSTQRQVSMCHLYAKIEMRSEFSADLPKLAQEFEALGSPLWALRTQNLQALLLEAHCSREKAVEVWERIIVESRWHTGSIFIYPTLMIFYNLIFRIGDNMGRRLYWYRQFEKDAKKEESKLDAARQYLHGLNQVEDYASLSVTSKGGNTFPYGFALQEDVHRGW